MTRAMAGGWLLGLAVRWVGAWIHAAWMLPTGLLIVLLGWSRAPWARRRGNDRERG